MKALLALLISAWLGFGGGAVVDGVIPGFWIVWSVVGCVLVAMATVYIVHIRERSFNEQAN